ncbi:MAG: hypothetical protein HOW97_14590 [Catenulispora sp.]|nr:hypothetical protein [Catenulispora sp.]
MRTLVKSLTDHIASLSQAGLDALFNARPDVAGIVFADVPQGEPLRADAGTVVAALADPEGVIEALEGLSRPEIQVLMALREAASGRAKQPAGQAGQAGGYRGRALPGGAAYGRGWVVSSYDPAVRADAELAREALCAPLAEVARSAAAAEFDRITARLTDVCLVWPEKGTALLRLHDVAVEFLPDPTDEWRAFDPVPTAPRVARRLAVAQVDAEAQAVAASALESCERLLGQIATQAVPLLKAGGVGAREIKRLGRVCGLEEQAVRFWLAVAEYGRLVACQGTELMATPEYDQWRMAEPAERYAALFAAWFELPTSVLGPFAPLDRSGKVPAPLSDAAYDGAGHQIRGALLGMLTACGAGAVPEQASLAEALVWRLPLLMDPPPELEFVWGEFHTPSGYLLAGEPLAEGPPTGPIRAAAAIETVMAEGGLLGAVAHGAAAPLTRALLDASGRYARTAQSDFDAALAATVPPTTDRVRLQGDMTVVATGLPSAGLAAFFDAAADRESAGGATVWRISDGSVRRWLDAGRSAEELLTGLAEFCEDATPQALRYLITDAARRHGLVDVIAARAVLVTADAQLGAELAVLPALLALGARRVAETVLVVDAPQQEVLRVLRFAGYLPSAHDVDGSPSVTTVASPRASVGEAGW